MGVWNVAAFSDSFVWSNDEREHDSLDGSVPIRRILKKYIVLANTVVLWKKIVLCNSEPSQHSYYAVLRFDLFYGIRVLREKRAKSSRVFRAFNAFNARMP